MRSRGAVRGVGTVAVAAIVVVLLFRFVLFLVAFI